MLPYFTIVIFGIVIANDYIRINRFNQSQPTLLFEEKSNLVLTEGEWDLHTFLNIEPFLQHFNEIITIINELKSVCPRIQKPACDYFYKLFLEAATNMELQNSIIADYTGSTQSRFRRGLINIGGRISKFLFGSLSDEDETKYNKILASLNSNQKKLIQRFSKLNQTDNKFNTFTSNLTRQINDQFKLFNNEINLIRRNQTNFENLDILLHSLTYSINHYNIIQKQLIDILANAERGILHPLVITPNTLRTSIAEIKTEIQDTLELPIQDSNHYHHYIAISKIHSFIYESNLHFVIGIPLISKTIYTVLRVLPIPVNVFEHTHKQLKVQNQYYVISNKTHEYFLMSDIQYQLCKLLRNNTVLCQKSHHSYKLQKSNNCVVQYFFGSTPQTCNYELFNLTHPIFVQMIAINTWFFYIPSKESLHVILTCKHTANICSYNLQSAGIISLHQSCSLHSNIQSIYASSISSILPPLKIFQINITIPPLLNNTALSKVPQIPVDTKYFSQQQFNPLTDFAIEDDSLQGDFYEIQSNWFDIGDISISTLIFICLLIISILCFKCRNWGGSHQPPTNPSIIVMQPPSGQPTRKSKLNRTTSF